MRLFLLLTTLATLATLLAGGSSAAGAAPPPLASYGRLPALEMVRLSPTGDRIAFIAVEGETRRLFIRKVGGDALMVSTVGAAKVRDLHWAGDDHVLVYVTETAKYGNGIQSQWGHDTRLEVSGVLIADLNTHVVRPMFDIKGSDILFGDVFNYYGTRKLDGRWYEFVSALTRIPLEPDVYKVDLDSGKFTALTLVSGPSYDYLVGDDGAIAARSRYNEATRIWSLFVGVKGAETVLTRPSPLDTPQIAGLGRTPGTLLVFDHDAQSQSWEEYPVAAKAAPTPLFKDMEVGRLLRDPASDALLGALAPDGQSAVLFDPKLQRRFDAARKAFAGYQITLESWSTDLTRMVLMTDGADDPGTFWLIDMTTGKAEELMPGYPDIDARQVGPTRLFSYAAADGLALDGVLTLPPGVEARALPLVMMPHGGPMGFHDRVGFDWWAQAFASRGYAVFQPNYRGSDGRGQAFQEKGYGAWGRGMMSDMKDGLDALAKAGVVDPRRAAIVGASYGGYAALAGVTVQHGLYRCAVAYAGVSDVGGLMARYGFDDETAQGRYVQKLFGARAPYEQGLLDISPLRHAAAADGPILLIHGKDDTRVPIVNSLAMAGALKNAGKPAEMVTLEGEDHSLSKQVTRVQTLEASVGFVEKCNPPGPAR